MIYPKTSQEIEIMREGGRMLAQIKEAVSRMLAVGVTPLDVDQKAEELLFATGGKPSFQMVKDYHWATCININDGVVHGIPNKIPFKEGDLVKVDLGLFYKGLHTDTAFTQVIGRMDPETEVFLRVGKEALNKAIAQAAAGKRISDISRAMQIVIEKQGYSPVLALTGHGIGKDLHEEPQIPCLWQSNRLGQKIPEGAVFAIEAIYTQGSPELVLSCDNWTLSTKDGKIAGYFEETVVATAAGPLILTKT